MVKRYGDEAQLEAAARADQLQEDGGWQGAVTWHRILDAIERIPKAMPSVPSRNSEADSHGRISGRE